MTKTPDFKSVNYSVTTITELMIPSYSNFGGKIHGGIIMSLMDKVAYACAAKHSGGYCVTVTVDNVDFLQPVEVGELVSLMASVNYVGNTSVVVGIKVVAENVEEGSVKHTNSSFITMVAKDRYGNPVKVPGLILENREQVRRFLREKKRREFKKNYRKNLQEELDNLGPEKEMDELRNEKCEIKLPFS